MHRPCGGGGQGGGRVGEVDGSASAREGCLRHAAGAPASTRAASGSSGVVAADGWPPRQPPLVDPPRSPSHPTACRAPQEDRPARRDDRSRRGRPPTAAVRAAVYEQPHAAADDLSLRGGRLGWWVGRGRPSGGVGGGGAGGGGDGGSARDGGDVSGGGGGDGANEESVHGVVAAATAAADPAHPHDTVLSLCVCGVWSWRCCYATRSRRWRTRTTTSCCSSPSSRQTTGARAQSDACAPPPRRPVARPLAGTRRVAIRRVAP